MTKAKGEARRGKARSEVTSQGGCERSEEKRCNM